MADEPNKPNRPIRPRQGAPGRKRRVVIEGGTNRPNPRHNRGRTDAMPKREKQEVAPPTGPATVPSEYPSATSRRRSAFPPRS